MWFMHFTANHFFYHFLNMSWTNVNPVSVTKFLMDLCVNEFDCDHEKEPTDEDKMVAYILFEKFAKLTTSYEFQDDYEYEEGGEFFF